MLSTTVWEAHVKVTVRKTGKTYHRKCKYAKHEIIKRGSLDEGGAEHSYYLRTDPSLRKRGWREVGKEEYEEATSDEAVRRIHEVLSSQLRERVEKIMAKEGEE